MLTSSLVVYVYIIIPIANFVNNFLLPLPTFFIDFNFKSVYYENGRRRDR
nr:MAG TPA: hypothetical protein [Caudoviricetes sp.]